MRAPKEKLRITVVPPEAPSAGMAADDVVLLLARLIGRQIAREHLTRETRKPDRPAASEPST
jgi:hypothetical protein